LGAGVREVWVINSEQKTAKVYRPDGSILPIPENGVLDGGSIVPGFRCPLRELMTLPKPPASKT
jgi:hypothetical protein